MDLEIKVLMQADAAGRLLQELPMHKLTPELGAAAREVFDNALEARDGDTAIPAGLLAATIYDAIGDQTNRVLNLVDVLQVKFMVANTVPEYEDVRSKALFVLGLADKAKAPLLAFYSIVIAADSAFFAAEAADNSPAWIITTLGDLTTACGRAKGIEKDFYFVKFVDLLASAVNMAMYRVFAEKDQPQIDLLLTSIAQKVDDLVPPDFEFPDNPQQTAKIAAILASLTDKYASQS